MDEIQEELLAELEQRHTRHLAQIKADHDELLQRKIEVLCNEFASHDTAQSILAKVAHVRETDEPKPSSETLARRLSAGMRAHASQLVESEYAHPFGVMQRGRFGVGRRGAVRSRQVPRQDLGARAGAHRGTGPRRLRAQEDCRAGAAARETAAPLGMRVGPSGLRQVRPLCPRIGQCRQAGNAAVGAQAA
jgi:hypothetical protein